MTGNLELRQVGVIAEKEFWDRIRNRWVLGAAGLFTAFALAIAYLGAAQQGAVGFRGIDATIASLVSLVIYLVPLIALLLGYDAIVGERDKGSLPLLLSMPVTRFELLLGKYIGLAAALAFSTLAGFGIAGLLLSYRMGLAALYQYGAFLLSALLLGWAFLSIALLISVLAADRVRASAAAIAIWFFYVLIYDLLLLGLLVATQGKLGLSIFPLLLMLNPADVFRILNVFGFEDVQRLYGLATVFPKGLANAWCMGAAMVSWILVPLGFAVWRFR